MSGKEGKGREGEREREREREREQRTGESRNREEEEGRAKWERKRRRREEIRELIPFKGLEGRELVPAAEAETRGEKGELAAEGTKRGKGRGGSFGWQKGGIYKGRGKAERRGFAFAVGSFLGFPSDFTQFFIQFNSA